MGTMRGLGQRQATDALLGVAHRAALVEGERVSMCELSIPAAIAWVILVGGIGGAIAAMIIAIDRFIVH